MDGNLIGTVSYFSSLPYTSTVHIGADSGGHSRFNGIIDEVALYGSALSASQIQTHYQAGISAVPEPASVLWLTLGVTGVFGLCCWRRGGRAGER